MEEVYGELAALDVSAASRKCVAFIIHKGDLEIGIRAGRELSDVNTVLFAPMASHSDKKMYRASLISSVLLGAVHTSAMQEPTQFLCGFPHHI